MEQFREGQRWISESEPELGLGTLLQVSNGRVKLLFPASGESRQYASDNAPLKRVRFRAGDTIETHEGLKVKVRGVKELKGLITYETDERDVPEALLSDTISFHRPEDRLLAAQVDDPSDFSLRRRTLEYRNSSRKSEVRGFAGGRIDLIPHQLSIAHEVSSRYAPRVLLSDEVGLGKTIEACLILHRMILTGRAERILVLVPESLVHQWFLEMMRRFNIWLSIFDEERCAAIEAGQPDTNPFLDDQLILASIQFLSGSPKRAAQALAASWDILVVDEAHHLEWSPNGASPEYQVVEALSKEANGLLLLTATPEQLGMESHFARLRLLDPERYGDLEQFRKESEHYREVAKLVEKISSGAAITREDQAMIEQLFKSDKERSDKMLQVLKIGTTEERTQIVEDLLDLHGPGRVMFRNTRAAVRGFPKRKPQLILLEPNEDHEEWVDRLSMEFAADIGEESLEVEFQLEDDPRVEWLAKLLQTLAPQKILLICRTKEKALALDEALRLHIKVNSSVFHEGLTLLERDRNAAYFGEEEGARILICSEIGSEGRNFQFAHHLVMFDLPLNPELLEQRVGRLDRIGQTEDIKIYVPFIRHSPQEVLARWYHEGLNAFETSLAGGNVLLKQFGRQVHDLALEFAVAEPAEAEKELSALLKRTSEARQALAAQLEQGRDRLLEMNSFRPKVAQRLIEEIRRDDDDPALEEYMLDVFDHFGVQVEELAPRTYSLNPEGVITDAFPSIPEEGMIVTFDRKRSLGRDDVGFLTWDHPMVAGAMDLVLDSEKGNSSFGVLADPKNRTLMMECVFVVEAIAEGRLHVDRFLASTPLRIVVDHKGTDLSKLYPERGFDSKIQKGSPFKLLDNPEFVQEVIPSMIRAAHQLAEAQSKQLVEQSLKQLNTLMDHEIKRLKMLQKVNNHIRPDEIAHAQESKDKMAHAIQGAGLRLDSVRLIWKGPPEFLK